MVKTTRQTGGNQDGEISGAMLTADELESGPPPPPPESKYTKKTI